MLNYLDLKKGTRFVMEGQPYEVLDFRQMVKAQGTSVAQTKVRNLVTGKVIDKTFRQGDELEEAELQNVPAKFIYAHRGTVVFCHADDKSQRFELSEDLLGEKVQFLIQHMEVNAVMFNESVITVELPIKVQLRVKEAPPGLKGDRAQGGSKLVTLETGAKINTPLFVEEGDIIEVNTETGEYSRRVE